MDDTYTYATVDGNDILHVFVAHARCIPGEGWTKYRRLAVVSNDDAEGYAAMCMPMHYECVVLRPGLEEYPLRYILRPPVYNLIGRSYNLTGRTPHEFRVFARRDNTIANVFCSDALVMHLGTPTSRDYVVYGYWHTPGRQVGPCDPAATVLRVDTRALGIPADRIHDGKMWLVAIRSGPPAGATTLFQLLALFPRELCVRVTQSSAFITTDDGYRALCNGHGVLVAREAFGVDVQYAAVTFHNRCACAAGPAITADIAAELPRQLRCAACGRYL